MSQISSINFKKSIAINTAHNDRTLAPSYLISDRGVECDRPDEQARELKEQIIAQAKETYTSRTGQRFQAKTYEWSAVCNIKPDTTMDDLKRLAQHFSDEYGFQCYQIAIHRDEGHIDEDGKEQINHHAHLEFITLDKNTGVNCFKMRDFPKSKMREIQSEVSQILQMQRGEDKRKSGRQRTEPRQYAKQKEAEKKATKKTKQDLLTQKAIKERLEQERKALIAENERLNQQIEDIEKDAKYRERETINTLIGVNNSLESVLSDERTPSHIKPLIHKEKSTTGLLDPFKAMFFKYSETEKEPSLRVLLKTFVRQINQLFEAYRAALTTIKDQAEQIKTLMELDKDTAELQSKIKKLEAENTALKQQQQRQQPQSNAELEKTKRKLNIYVVENQELKDELKQKTKEYDEFQCELADILDIDYFDSEDLKSDIMLNVQSLKSGENISRNKESIDALRADISSISTQFNELFNSSDDTKQEEQQSDEEKHRTFKARKQ
jgi:mobilization protein